MPDELTGAPAPTGIAHALAGVIDDLSRAVWPVVVALLSVLLVAVFGLSLFAMAITWTAFVAWVVVGTLSREREASADVGRVASYAGRLFVATTVVLPIVPMVIVASGSDERGFFLSFGVFSALVAVAAAYLLTIGWGQHRGWRPAIPALVVWSYASLWGFLLTEVATPVAVLQALAHLFAFLVLLALFARLLSFSSSPARLLLSICVAVVAVELCAYLLVSSATLRAAIAAGNTLWLKGLLVVAVAIVLGEALTARGARFGAIGGFWRGPAGAPVPTSRRGRLATVGFVLGLVAIAVVATGSLLSALTPRLLYANFTAPVRYADPSELTFFSSEKRPSDGELAFRFSPVLLTRRGARHPAAVKRFLSGARLERVDGRVILAHVDETALADTTCSVGLPAVCYRLALGCPIEKHDGDACRGAGLSYPHDRTPVYARVLRRRQASGAQTAEQQWVFRRAAAPLTALVQYWYFYNYDDWVGDTVWGQIEQSHDGDWEAVTVGLSVDDDGSFTRVNVLFVAASAHCGGTWKDTFVRMTTGPLPNKWRPPIAEASPVSTHPLIYIANGSQANYFDGRIRTPDWASCLGIGNAKVAAASTAYEIREKLGGDVVLRSTRVEDLHPVKSSSAIIRFPGRWGSSSNMSFTTVTGRRFPNPGEGAPLSPGLQTLWIDPVKTIFCDPRWRLSRYVGETVYVEPPPLWTCERRPNAR